MSEENDGYVLSESLLGRIRTMLTAFEEGRMNVAPPRRPLDNAGPLWTHIGRATQDIDGAVSLIPGQGLVQLEQILDVGGGLLGIEEADSGEVVTAYNISPRTCALGEYVALSRDPFSGKWVFVPMPNCTSVLLPGKVCVTKATVSGTQVVTSISQEFDLWDTCTWKLTSSYCLTDQTDCCPSSPGCCCVCGDGTDDVCATFSNGTGELACANGFTWTIYPVQTHCQGGPNGDSILYEAVVGGGANGVPDCLLTGVCGETLPLPPGDQVRPQITLTCPSVHLNDWHSILLNFTWVCSEAVGGGEKMTWYLTGPVAPTSGSCGPVWSLTYTAVPIWRKAGTDANGRFAGTMDITISCNPCGGSGPTCSLSAIGEGAVTRTTSGNQLLIHGVPRDAHSMLVVDISWLGSATITNVTIGGTNMTAGPSRAFPDGSGTIAMYYLANSTGTASIPGDLVCNFSVNVTDAIMVATEYPGPTPIAANLTAIDHSNSANGTVTPAGMDTPDSGPITASTFCEVVHAAFALSGQPCGFSAPWVGEYTRNAGSNLYQVSAHQITSTGGTFDATCSHCSPGEKWAGYIVSFD